ncbi:hypothetical protein [Spongiactinospora sp. 9N601]|uniref:hypothetical protein n=1 Tax=Spongiactinospora sp. 9N601 TaxID=3375149 RepID=UPI0037975A2E
MRLPLGGRHTIARTQRLTGHDRDRRRRRAHHGEDDEQQIVHDAVRRQVCRAHAARAPRDQRLIEMAEPMALISMPCR